ncbi:hypothetical protein K435DRAFT_862371 [Dendrothele bispora CBS 962.96]|uniref:Uncharacterized protein n=1 Tax=Dendrothele bispora (strain CBS 962.96) TaxID=1314807 RepID=A0A4S8LSM9_DENBC|nr:hypothetical protein K435DRAFT_862371 [Dendrothele bispora CBS 962.96]
MDRQIFQPIGNVPPGRQVYQAGHLPAPSPQPYPFPNLPTAHLSNDQHPLVIHAPIPQASHFAPQHSFDARVNASYSSISPGALPIHSPQVGYGQLYPTQHEDFRTPSHPTLPPLHEDHCVPSHPTCHDNFHIPSLQSQSTGHDNFHMPRLPPQPMGHQDFRLPPLASHHEDLHIGVRKIRQEPGAVKSVSMSIMTGHVGGKIDT